MDEPRLIPLPGHVELPEPEMQTRAAGFLAEMRRRRTVRDYADRAVPRGVIEDCILTAGTAPSGANRQPWHFVVVRRPEVKRAIREAAEKEERAFYARRAPDEWLEALEPLGTGPEKPFLERAPCLIVVFAKSYDVDGRGKKTKNYYVTESVGIATGILITAIHRSGLVSLTHTPSPMGFLSQILGRPGNERPFLILAVGYPDETAMVPDIARKTLREIVTSR